MTRSYSLPNPLLDRLETLPTTRTESLRRAIKLISDDPSELVRALEHRITSGEGAQGGRLARVTVSFTEDTVQQLSKLTEYSQLPTEHVLRLAVEAYLRSLG